MGLAGPGRQNVKRPSSKARYRITSERHPWNKPGLSRADRVIRFVSSLPCTAGPLAGKNFQLRPWQEEFIRAVYATDARGRRLVRTAVLSMGRGNGKTTLAAALALCHLAGPEAERRGEIYSAANDRFQATRIFNELSAIALEVPWLAQRLTIRRFTKEIEDRGRTGSLYAALSADAPTKLGFSISFCVYDELPYTEATKPERNFYARTDRDIEELNIVYAYLRNWAKNVKLNLNPAMPSGVIRRFADNARGLLSIADSCGQEWGQKAREAITFLLAKEKSERPENRIVQHGLVIFEMLGLDQIGSVRFNKELRQLDLPDARWTRYRGPSGTDYARPLEMHEQAFLLKKVGIRSMTLWPSGKRQDGNAFRGYKRAQFEDALRRYETANDAEPERKYLKLVND